MGDPVAAATELVASLAPGGRPVPVRVPLETDEASWFVRSVTDGVVEFGECPEDCFRYRKWGVSGPDHFWTPAGKPRHLFSKPDGEVAWLNREYVPHIAAYGLAVLAGGYDRAHSSFSRYRVFGRDLVTKRRGQSFETDAEFYAGDGSVWLQVEAKASLAQTARLAAQIREHSELRQLPASVVKEIEYVLDLAPRFLWVVGPGSVDPQRYVSEVQVAGDNALFTPRIGLPPAP